MNDEAAVERARGFYGEWALRKYPGRPTLAKAGFNLNMGDYEAVEFAACYAASETERADRAEQTLSDTPAGDHAFLHLDDGIKRAVLALNAAGIRTFESCEGGAGHAFLEPTISFRGDMNEGLMAVAILRRERFKVWELRRRWRMVADELDGPFWDVVLVEKDTGRVDRR